MLGQKEETLGLTQWLSGEKDTCSAGDVGDAGWEDPLAEGMAAHSSILA